MAVTRIPATPDPLVLLCIIGGAVRGAGEWNLLMQLLVICTYSPALKHALLAWLVTEERYQALEFEEEAGVVEDGWGGLDGLYRGFMTPKGRVVLWRHVTRFGLAVMIPVITAVIVRAPGKLVPTCGWSLTRSLGDVYFFSFSRRVLAVLKNCVQIVPVS